MDVYNQKKEIENKFDLWVNTDNARREKYGEALKLIAEGYADLKKYNLNLKYLEEAVFQGPEFIYSSFGAYSLYSKLTTLSKTKDKTTKAALENDVKELAKVFKTDCDKFFKDYNAPTDKKLFIGLLQMYYKNVSKDQHPDVFTNVLDKKFKGDFNKWADYLFAKSIFVNQERMNAFLANPTYKQINADPGFQITLSMVDLIRSIYSKTGDTEEKINKGNRLFVAGLMEMNPDKKFYPNANSTMRLTYGKVMDYKAADAVHYDYYTTLDGVMEKEDASNEEFIVSDKLKQLYKSKDYGRYGSNGVMPVCFTANLDITGGNSGSPVINADGNLIGIAFDGNWEAMSGDIAYEPEVQRTICVDIRYVMFVIDKYAGAKNLVDEMTLVQ
jgi:hypothetical protein